jgi:hypothetical protein
MKTRLLAGLLLALVGTAACNEETAAPDGPYTLTFEGNESFQGAHGDQTIRVALLDAAGEVDAVQSGTVSATATPSFSFTFEDALESGASYEVHYWIDSNFGGGTASVCDPMTTDHQWAVPVNAVAGDVTVTDSHRPTEIEDVCSTFAADLTFQGDDSFNGPHGDQPIEIGLVRSSDGALVTTMSGTVSASENPSFAFELPGALLKDTSYEVHYWIDSNFGGGTAGTCDPVNTDHQWSVDLGTPMDDSVVHTESHDAGAQSAVCATFE